jgi:hypothetical protein
MVLDQPAPRSGIVTLADSHYFPGLETLYVSAQQSCAVPVACFNLGLTGDQIERAAERYPRLSILQLPDTPDIAAVRHAFSNATALAKPGKRVWPLWICPFLIAASPFERVFWMDCDILVLRDLEGLFALLDQGPVFTPENLAPAKVANKPELYERLPIDRFFDRLSPAANGGVSGWDLDRDGEVLEAYMHPVRKACTDEAIRNAISWHDQGALNWAIRKTGLEHRVVSSWKWNLSVKHTAAAGKRYDWNDSVVDVLRRDVPDANLLHWNGYPVPWAA